MPTLDIATARAELCDELEAALGIQVLDTLPARMPAPCAFLREADEFIRPEEDGPFGSVVLQWDAVVVLAPAAQSEQITDADRLVTRLLAATDFHARYHLEVNGYSTDTHGGQPYLIIPLHITQ